MLGARRRFGDEETAEIVAGKIGPEVPCIVVRAGDGEEARHSGFPLFEVFPGTEVGGADQLPFDHLRRHALFSAFRLGNCPTEAGKLPLGATLFPRAVLDSCPRTSCGMPFPFASGPGVVSPGTGPPERKGGLMPQFRGPANDQIWSDLVRVEEAQAEDPD